MYIGSYKLSKSHFEEPVITRPPIVYAGNELYDLLQTQSPADDENWLKNGGYLLCLWCGCVWSEWEIAIDSWLAARKLPSHSLLSAFFVGSFERRNYVYFFFHETATEFKGCLQETVSRVARVCKVH